MPPHLLTTLPPPPLTTTTTLNLNHHHLISISTPLRWTPTTLISFQLMCILMTFLSPLRGIVTPSRLLPIALEPLSPHPLVKNVILSRTLLRAPAMPLYLPILLSVPLHLPEAPTHQHPSPPPQHYYAPTLPLRAPAGTPLQEKTWKRK